jgi:hypothetical protein
MMKSNGGSGNISNCVFEIFIGHSNVNSPNINGRWTEGTALVGDGVLSINVTFNNWKRTCTAGVTMGLNQRHRTKVESWCIECKEKTTTSRLSGGCSVFVDEKPRWTVAIPAKYVERKPNCLTCHTGSNRFVPVDEKVHSIAKAELVTFAKEFGDSLTDAELAVALQR